MNPFTRRIAVVLAVFILAVPVALVAAAPALLYGATVIGKILPNHTRYTEIDEDEILVDVMTRTPYRAEENKTVQYFSLASGRRIRETEPFEPDPMSVYTVENPSDVYFQQALTEAEEKQSFIMLGITDEAGNSVPLTKDFMAILIHLDEVEQWIMTLKILDVGGRLFAYTEQNVNLWTPCTLYQYDPDTMRLTELYTWDNKEPVGLRVH